MIPVTCFYLKNPPVGPWHALQIFFAVTSRNSHVLLTDMEMYLHSAPPTKNKKYKAIFTQGHSFWAIFFTETYTYNEDKVLDQNQLDRKQNNFVLKEWIRFNVGQQDGQTPCFIYTYIMMLYSATHLLLYFSIGRAIEFAMSSTPPIVCWCVIDTSVLLMNHWYSVVVGSI
jgi:hypothetical protein